MSRLPCIVIAVLCMGCSPPQALVEVVDPAPVEAVRPSGPHPVGVGAGPVIGGRVQSRLYYPAVGPTGPGGTRAITPEHRSGLARRFGPGVAGALERAVTAAAPDARPAPGRHPLVIFAPGANMGAGDYRLLIENLASRGYVVLALNPQGSPPPSGPRYEAAAEELLAALALVRSGGNPAFDQVDSARVAFVGHSLGGAAAVIAMTRAPGVTAINLDGDLTAAPVVPHSASLLYLLGQTAGEAGRSRTRRADVWTTLSAGVSDAVALQIVTMKHFDFADAALLQDAMPMDKRETRFGSIGGSAAHALTVDLVAAFLDSRLRGARTAWSNARARHPGATAPSTW